MKPIRRYRRVAAWGLAGAVWAVVAGAQTDGAAQGQDELRSPPVAATSYDNYYTIQIGAFSSQQQAVEFARKLALPAEQLGVARILVNDHILFVLAFGMYPDKASAQQAVAVVCGEHDLDGCWARGLGEVRELSRAAQARGETAQ